MPEGAVGLTDLNVDQFVWHYCWRRVQPWGNLLGFLEFKTGKMAKTKTTPNYEFRRCPMCSYSARSEEDYKGHVFKCAMRTFKCPVCDFCNNKEANLKRHMKRCHPGLA